MKAFPTVSLGFLDPIAMSNSYILSNFFLQAFCFLDVMSLPGLSKLYFAGITAELLIAEFSPI